MAERFIIRPPLPSEYGAIARVFHEAVWQIARLHYTEDQLRAWSPKELPPEHWQKRTANLEMRVALIGDRIAGFIGFSHSGHIDLLYTCPEFVRRGVARALLLDAEDMLCKLGVETAWTEASLSARDFFLSMGYNLVQEQIVFCGGVQLRNCRMNKSLTQPSGEANDSRQDKSKVRP